MGTTIYSLSTTKRHKLIRKKKLKMKFILAALLLIAVCSVTADNSTETATCTMADNEVAYTACEALVTTCTTAIGVCELAGGAAEEACTTAATTAFNTAFDLLSTDECTCDLTCSSSTIAASIFMAVVAKFML